MNQYRRVALFGGIYSNHLGLKALLAEAQVKTADAIFFLGDIGGFGPHPDRSCEILRESSAICIQGNYEDSVGNGKQDCGCGYTDPRDNRYAQLSYDYTLSKTSKDHREWMKTLPTEHRFLLGDRQVLLCHGSPRKQNEFLWETGVSRAFLIRLLQDHQADVICSTHTGLHWHKALGNGRHVVNVGVIGRPANDGRTNVWYTLLEVDEACPGAPKSGAYPGVAKSGELKVTFVPLAYDFERLAKEMEAESLPPEFVQTIRTGWWTTCLEILPAKERARGKF